MWLLIPAAAAFFLGFLAIHFGWLPPPHARTIIRVRSGMIRVSRGQLRAPARQQVDEILGGAGVTSGFIAITPDNRVRFSARIPSEIRQRLRNVVLNQHAS